MAAPKINENCHYVRNDPRKCKIKPEKFQFDILCRFGVIKESLQSWGQHPPPGEIGSNEILTFLCQLKTHGTNQHLIKSSFQLPSESSRAFLICWSSLIDKPFLVHFGQLSKCVSHLIMHI